MKTVNVAVIGAGYWGKKVTGEYARLSKEDSGLHLFGVCDLSEDNLRYCRENFGIPFLTDDYMKVLASPDIDAVDICTPNETHYEICRDALEFGKHVLVEKPMTLKADEAFKLVELARRKSLVLCVGHIFRFSNALNEVRRLIREGFFGDISYLRLQWTTLMPPIEGRDIVTDLAPHPFDILNFLLDEWPQKITCKAKPCRRERLEEVAHIVAEFDGNLLAYMELSWLHPGKTREVLVAGSKRIVRIDCLTQEVTVFENGRSHRLEVESNNTIQAEIRHFWECIQNNGLAGFEVQNSGIIGGEVVRLLEVARRSLKEGRTVSTKPMPKVRQVSRYSVIKDVQIGEGARIYDQVNLYGCEIGRGCKIDAYVYVEGGVKIGDNCKVRAFTFIPTGVVIEDDVFIGPNVTFTNDKYPSASGQWKLLPTRVKKGASIGANSIILPGITIGRNALVGAGSVVTKDVPNFAVVAGNPARQLKTKKYRLNREQLLDTYIPDP